MNLNQNLNQNQNQNQKQNQNQNQSTLISLLGRLFYLFHATMIPLQQLYIELKMVINVVKTTHFSQKNGMCATFYG